MSEGGGGRFAGWIVSILIVVVLNILSRVFNWGWTFY